MKPERRYLNHARSRVRLEKRDDGTGVMAGYASVFYDGSADTEYELWQEPGFRCVERILPGAFGEVLSRGDDVHGLFNHDRNLVLGRTSTGTMRLTQDSRGLAYEIDPPGTQYARDLAECMKRGDVSGSSFSFEPVEAQFRRISDDSGETVVREIVRANIFDVGPVTVPAYTGATSGLRRALPAEEARASFEAWKKSQGPCLAAMLAQVRARAVEVTER